VIPVGCFAHHTCRLTISLSAGGSSLGSARRTTVPSGRGGLAAIALSSAGRHVLARAPSGGLTVLVSVRDQTGLHAARHLRLFGYMTSGPSPPRSATQSSTIQLVGTSEYADRQGEGGILAACYGATPCHVNLSLSVQGRVVARPGVQVLGANELGYLGFRLSPAGRSMLSHAAGNQLAANLLMANGRAVAGGHVVLSRYG
jgi:hypothetical protein